MDKFALYIHVPFCRSGKCMYCEFYSVPLDQVKAGNYLSAVQREIDLAPAEYAGAGVSSVFFGGGTPSLLEPEAVANLLERVRAAWEFEPEAEISLEANPEDVSPDRARGWLKAGVNRLSVGCQSFDDETLNGLGRSHDSACTVTAVRNALDAGFAHVSADLILGGPKSSTATVLESIETALALGVRHLSIYGYHLEETCAAREIPCFAECEEEIYREQYLAACGFLDGTGWRHYEMSNWASSPETECRHNLAYWTGRPYLGLGPAAHSFLPPDRRFWNVRDLDRYLEAMVSGSHNCREVECLSVEDIREERLMLGLRLSTGIPLVWLDRSRGNEGINSPSALAEEGLVRLENGRVRATDRGFLVFDSLVDALLGRPVPELDNKRFDYQN